MEFVNPKYKAGSRTDFKKPTRLECMMQDFPKLMSKELGNSAKVCVKGGREEFRVWHEEIPQTTTATMGGGTPVFTPVGSPF